MQVEAKNLIDGRKLNNRFRSADTVEKVRLDTKDFQFLYAEGDDLVFMDKDSFEQINIGKDVVGEAHEFLQDGMDVVLELWEERPISVELPETIEATIVEADAVRSEEHTSELQSLMRISYAVFCLKTKTTTKKQDT